MKTKLFYSANGLRKRQHRHIRDNWSCLHLP
jgi:hypothetical protein